MAPHSMQPSLNYFSRECIVWPALLSVLVLLHANRDSKSLLEYVTSVEEALRTVSSATKCSPDVPLSTEFGLAAVVGDKRQSSCLLAVQTLVRSFVMLHNSLVSKLLSVRDYS